jgi:hypothetical protein
VNAATMSEIDDLREENARLRADLDSQRRECEILRSIPDGRFGQERASARAPWIEPTPRVLYLEMAVEKLDDALRVLSYQECYSECHHVEPGLVREPCGSCIARKVLAEVHDWRFGGSTTEPMRGFAERFCSGAMYKRVPSGWNPREARMHAAWCKELGRRDADRYLGLILSERSEYPSWPSARDWFTATSVVQWLATNCGMAVLEGAGFTYKHFDEDHRAIDAKRRALQVVPEMPAP